MGGILSVIGDVFNRYGTLALSFEALEPGYWPGLSFALVSG